MKISKKKSSIRGRLVASAGVLILALGVVVAQDKPAQERPTQEKAAHLMARAGASGLVLGVVAKPPQETQEKPAQDNDVLKTVIAQMNASASKFRNIQADFEWESYNSVVKEKETQTGTSYFRRSGDELEAMLDVKEPTPKQLLYSKGKVKIYEVKINRVTERNVGGSQSDRDAVMSLGFGGRGDELLKSYDVKSAKWENIGAVRTARLELVGKTPGLQKAFSKAIIWIDPERDIAMQQQFFEGSSGDYRLTRYHNIKVNTDIKNDSFKLHTKGDTSVVQLN